MSPGHATATATATVSTMAQLLRLPFLLLVAVTGATTAYDFSPDWTIEMPLPYTREVANAFLNAHNVRRNVPPVSAANMRRLAWNVSLAEAAANHVRKCAFEHDTLGNTIGQVLELGGASELNEAKAYATLEAWYERDLAAHPMDENGKMELNFASQILWAETASVGCASQWCPNVVRHAKGATGVLTACNYFPPGNFPDRAVFQVGRYCSQCPPDAPFCDNTLCTSEPFTFASHLQRVDPSIP